MDRFSQRYGYQSTKSINQIDSIDQDLRTAIWNVIYENFITNIHDPIFTQLQELGSISRSSNYPQIVNIWKNFFKLPIDEIPQKIGAFIRTFKNKYMELDWYKVYDLVEFFCTDVNLIDKRKYINEMNLALQNELSAYRIVNKTVVPLTNEVEIAEIDQAIKSTSDVSIGARIHIESAIQYFSNRKEPDYRNSIKESISAVESICNLICGNEKATLGSALDIIAKSNVIHIHSALKIGFEKIYGYTSDEGGIRHSMLDEPNVDYEDAKYMLIACSGFVNYLIAKANKAGVIKKV